MEDDKYREQGVSLFYNHASQLKTTNDNNETGAK